MAALSLSPQARADLVDIGAYSLRTWGEARTIRYLNQLEDAMERLAGNPMLGRACDEIRPGLRRMQEGRHVIFYRRRERGIRVIRILHQNMLPESRLIGDGS
ncbi:MAG: type II toxin-antitoxin system RelE/ParE family toxin [Acidobacteriaceae bacterium]|jgi:toxin ParE1/3/4